MAKLIKRLVTEASPFDTTKRILRPDGEVRYIRCVGAPVVENQRLKRFVGTAVDVTEHEFLTQKLRRREAYLARAEALSHTGSFGWNPSSGQLFWSDETFSVLGYDQGVTPSLDLVFRRVHPDDVALVRETLSVVSKSEKSIDFEHRLLLPNGSIKYVHVVARPFERESGSIEFVGSVMDVTATKKAFEEIKALKDELDKENIVLRERKEDIPALVSYFVDRYAKRAGAKNPRDKKTGPQFARIVYVAREHPGIAECNRTFAHCLRNRRVHD